MKFSEAREKIKEMAKGQAYTIEYDELHHATGTIDIKCAVGLFVNGEYISSWVSGVNKPRTWEDAFAALKINMAGDKVPENFAEQVPENFAEQAPEDV